MKKMLLLICLIFAGIFTACSKEDNPTAPTDTTVKPLNYNDTRNIPLDKGVTWTYKNQKGEINSDTILEVVENYDIVLFAGRNKDVELKKVKIYKNKINTAGNESDNPDYEGYMVHNDIIYRVQNRGENYFTGDTICPLYSDATNLNNMPYNYIVLTNEKYENYTNVITIYKNYTIAKYNSKEVFVGGIGRVLYRDGIDTVKLIKLEKINIK